jgi:hypothetical protein
VVANVFCFLRNEAGLLNRVIKHMQDRLANVEEMI